MVETTLPRTSGRSSSLSSERWRFDSYPLFGGYTIALGTTGLITLVLFGLLIIGHDESSRAFEVATRQYQTVSGFVQRIQTMRIETVNFLATRQQSDLDRSESAISQLQNELMTSIGTPGNALSFDLQLIADSTSRYSNTFRSLERLILSGNLLAQKSLFEALGANAADLDQQANGLLQQTQSALDTSWRSMQDDNWRLRVTLLAGFILTFAISLGLTMRVTHQTAHDLRLIGQAAQAIAAGNMDTRVALTREDEIGNLGLAFNRMAEGLRTSLQTETAASEQNRRQILKLARQERVNAILEERQRIAHELHDSVKQQLFSITLAAGAALNLLKHSPELAKTYLEHVQQASTYAQSEMTTLLEELVPVPLQDQRLEDALSQYLRLLCDAHHVKLLWRVEGTNTLSIAQEHALFRAVQEAAANVVRHSKATLLRVSLSFGLQSRVIVEDNGQGFDTSAIPATSTGLVTMRLRLKRIGGSYELVSTPGSGTRLAITVDIRKKVNYEQF